MHMCASARVPWSMGRDARNSSVEMGSQWSTKREVNLAAHSKRTANVIVTQFKVFDDIIILERLSNGGGALAWQVKGKEK